MWNTGLDEAQAGIKTARRNTNNLRYADDTTLMADSEEQLKSLLMKLNKEGEKVCLKFNIQKTKILVSSPITSWQIDGETVETVTNFIFGGSKITADGDCSHEIKTLASWKKSYDQPRQHTKKQRQYFTDKGPSSQSYSFSSSHVWMWELDYKESWVPKNWCFFLNFFIFKFYNIVLVLPNIEMNPPQVYTCSPSWTLLPPPSPYHPSGSSQCTSPKHPVLCIEPGLASRFIHDIIHVSMPFSQIFPPSPSPTESIRLFYTSVSLLLSRTPGYCYHLSKFHIYVLVYCIGVFLSGLLHSV